jgi:hypothetical protein
MAEDGRNEAHEAGCGAYEPPDVSSLGSIEELTASPVKKISPLDDGG